MYRDKRNTVGTSENPREKHFNAWLYTYVSSVPQLNVSGTQRHYPRLHYILPQKRPLLLSVAEDITKEFTTCILLFGVPLLRSQLFQ